MQPCFLCVCVLVPKLTYCKTRPTEYKTLQDVASSCSQDIIQEAGEQYDHVLSRCTHCIFFFCLSIEENTEAVFQPITSRVKRGERSKGKAPNSHFGCSPNQEFQTNSRHLPFLSEPQTDILRGCLSSGRNQTKTGQEVQAQESEIQTLKMSHPSCEESKFYSVKFPLKFSIHLFSSIPFYLPS